MRSCQPVQSLQSQVTYHEKSSMHTYMHTTSPAFCWKRSVFQFVCQFCWMLNSAFLSMKDEKREYIKTYIDFGEKAGDNTHIQAQCANTHAYIQLIQFVYSLTKHTVFSTKSEKMLFDLLAWKNKNQYCFTLSGKHDKSCLLWSGSDSSQAPPLNDDPYHQNKTYQLQSSLGSCQRCLHFRYSAQRVMKSLWSLWLRWEHNTREVWSKQSLTQCLVAALFEEDVVVAVKARCVNTDSDNTP